MYQITCDGHILYDPRDDELVLLNPRCKLEVNTVGEGSFTILSTHPYYDKLKKLKSIFEVNHNGTVIFRGRMTGDSLDFYNQTAVDLEGILAFANDTMIPPFNFPEDFTIPTGENVVKTLLNWFINQHNSQVKDFQKFKLGNVTVTDANNVIVRSSDKFMSTWDCFKEKLFDSSLGGYMVVRYEPDGNYIDYLDHFEYTNTQEIVFGENLLDISTESDVSDTYSAILPIGKDSLNIASLPDGELDDDIVKSGYYVYSKSAVEQYGWICVPIGDSTWEDVTEATNLQRKAREYLATTANKMSKTITIKAVDLNFTDEEIQEFKAFRNVLVTSQPHGISRTSYALRELDIDILNPQNTVITLGDTVRTMVDINNQQQAEFVKLVENVQSNITENVRNQMVTQETSVIQNCNTMILNALKTYVETGDFNQYKEDVETQLEIMANGINMRFTQTNESIENVDGDVQKRFNELSKYIRFNTDGITIGNEANSLKLQLDNDMIKFSNNGLAVGWWDGVNFHTGNIVVEVNERAQFGNFAFIPRSDGSLMFLKVGGD